MSGGQPSPAGQDERTALIEEAIGYLDLIDVQPTLVDQARRVLARALAARQPVGQEPVVWVSPEQLEAHADPLRGEGGHYLPTRKTTAGKFTKPLFDTPPAQAVDLAQLRELLQRRASQWRSHLPTDPDAPGTRQIHTDGEDDYNNDVRIYREGISVMEELLDLIDKAVQS